jgi:UDP-N-acetylglucosamine 2-epimerase
MKRYKILHVVGARPQFVKMALVAEAAKTFGCLETVIVHTGQHYDRNMSDVFFSELKMPRPGYNLGVGSGSHAVQISKMIDGLGRILVKERPDAVFVYGDTNSTLAGAIAATKVGVKLVHVEAGLRSFNRSMPEEINRIMTDSVSDILFCPTRTAVDNLRAEGVSKGVFRVEDVMLDMLIRYSRIAEKKSKILITLGRKRVDYYLATVHRSYNTDDPKRLRGLIKTFGLLDKPVIFPMHPRTKKVLRDNKIALGRNIIAVAPVPYVDMLSLEMNAAAILTDSGGVQKEAFFLKVPCVTLREETEWVETVRSGWNILAGVDEGKIKRALSKLAKKRKSKAMKKPGSSAKKMLAITISNLRGKR